MKKLNSRECTCVYKEASEHVMATLYNFSHLIFEAIDLEDQLQKFPDGCFVCKLDYEAKFSRKYGRLVDPIRIDRDTQQQIIKGLKELDSNSDHSSSANELPQEEIMGFHGIHAKMTFKNGCGVHVILSDISLGSELGQFEVQISGRDPSLQSRFGHCTPNMVSVIMYHVQQLPKGRPIRFSDGIEELNKDNPVYQLKFMPEHNGARAEMRFSNGCTVVVLISAASPCYQKGKFEVFVYDSYLNVVTLTHVKNKTFDIAGVNSLLRSVRNYTTEQWNKAFPGRFTGKI